MHICTQYCDPVAWELFGRESKRRIPPIPDVGSYVKSGDIPSGSFLAKTTQRFESGDTFVSGVESSSGFDDSSMSDNNVAKLWPVVDSFLGDEYRGLEAESGPLFPHSECLARLHS